MKTWSVIIVIACLFGRGYTEEVDLGFMKGAKRVSVRMAIGPRMIEGNAYSRTGYNYALDSWVHFYLFTEPDTVLVTRIGTSRSAGTIAGREAVINSIAMAEYGNPDMIPEASALIRTFYRISPKWYNRYDYGFPEFSGGSILGADEYLVASYRTALTKTRFSRAFMWHKYLSSDGILSLAGMKDPTSQIIMWNGVLFWGFEAEGLRGTHSQGARNAAAIITGASCANMMSEFYAGLDYGDGFDRDMWGITAGYVMRRLPVGIFGGIIRDRLLLHNNFGPYTVEQRTRPIIGMRLFEPHGIGIGIYLNPAYRASRQDGTGWKFKPEAFFSVSLSLFRTSLKSFPLFPDVSSTPFIEADEVEEQHEERGGEENNIEI